MNYRVITPPSEPITLEEARTHLRVQPYGSPEAHPDDDYIEALITSAREYCEQYLRRALATQIIEFPLDDFGSEIDLPLKPAQQVESITYLDTAGATQTLATTAYGLDIYSGTIFLKSGQSWPTVLAQKNAITVKYTAGYTQGSPDDYELPEPIKCAMLLLIGNLYENRQEVNISNVRNTFNQLPFGAISLMQPYRTGLGV
jgi:uncharacterized phiE125 gp8 family phage protein